MSLGNLDTERRFVNTLDAGEIAGVRAGYGPGISIRTGAPPGRGSGRGARNGPGRAERPCAFVARTSGADREAPSGGAGLGVARPGGCGKTVHEVSS